MNAAQRKQVRDTHLRRLGGEGARVWLDGKWAARLQCIEGADKAQISFVSAGMVPSLWHYKADRLQRRA